MVVLDQFYQIVEKQTSTVSSFWKVIHTSTCIVSAVCGLLTAFTFGRILSDFNYNCILYAKLEFDNSTFVNGTSYRIPKTVRAIDVTSSLWGPTSECNFAQFTPLVVMISAILWGVFFAVMSKGGAGYKSDLLSSSWGIIYTCILFTVILSITYIISAVQLKNGLGQFCREFHSEFNNTKCVPEINIYVSQFQDRVPDILFYEFYPNFYVCLLTSDIGVWSWIFHCVVCFARVFLVADFDIQLVTIKAKDEEEVEKITDLDTSEMDEISEV